MVQEDEAREAISKCIHKETVQKEVVGNKGVPQRISGKGEYPINGL